jgi:preprotein translocase subunit SecA
MMAWWNKIIPTKNERELKRLRPLVSVINDLEAGLKALPDAALQAKSQDFRSRYEKAFVELGGDLAKNRSEGTKDERKEERRKIDEALQPILPEAFAVVREASRRVLGLRHYDVQMVGGAILHEGKIAEMRTGEGKTLMATLPVYLNAIAHRGVHVVTVNEYLASRDAQWMGQIYQFLGMDVGAIRNGIGDAERKAAYRAPITYGTNSEFGFDYLRDNMKLFLDEYVQRGHHFTIVDEVDSILIDEARTPLIISGPAEESTGKYVLVNGIIPSLRREHDFTVDEKARSVSLTEEGIHSVEQRLGVDNLYDPDHIELLHHVNQGLRAHSLYRRDVDYMVDQNKVKIIDEFTGRVLDGRRWSDGLHQAVEAKEAVAIQNENQTLATITYQNYFRNFLKLSGMTGTAETEAEEFAKIYDLDVVVIPTNLPIIRKDLPDQIYRGETEKFQAIVEDIQERSTKGQPCLVGTTSVEKSEVLSRQLKRLMVPHSVLNAKYHGMEAEIVAQAGSRGAVTIATNMAGRGTDILLGGNPESRAMQEVGQEADEKTFLGAVEKHKGLCEAEKKEVLNAGGLHIVGTERHESRRIDNQLRGRSGRQGDPGSSRFYLCLEDDLMRIFGGERLSSMMNTLGMQEGEVIEHKWVTRSIASAQRKVEGRNFDIRKNLLEYDDVMNDQRKAVYKLRREVIAADGPGIVKDLLLDQIEEAVLNLVDRACPARSHYDDWRLDLIENVCREVFNFEVDFGRLEDLSPEDLEEVLFDQVKAQLEMREEEFTSDAFMGVARIIYLQQIDKSWKEHLREMDHLREGIGLRGYAQKDPKQEYKKEGYNLFVSMMGAIGTEVLQKVYRVVVTAETEDVYQRKLEAQKSRQQRDMKIGGPRKKAKKPETVRRASPKLGRNDPCSCGSGRKYKKCCMGTEARA